MRARVSLMLVCLALTLSMHGCGDNDNSVKEPFVFVNGGTVRGSKCPDGATFAYRTKDLIVCDACADARGCIGGQRCLTQCGPDCEDDAGGCCPVRVCSPPLPL